MVDAWGLSSTLGAKPLVNAPAITFTVTKLTFNALEICRKDGIWGAMADALFDRLLVYGRDYNTVHSEHGTKTLCCITINHKLKQSIYNYFKAVDARDWGHGPLPPAYATAVTGTILRRFV